MFFCSASLSLSHMAARDPHETASSAGHCCLHGTATAASISTSGEGTLLCPLLFRLENRQTPPLGCHSQEHTLLSVPLQNASTVTFSMYFLHIKITEGESKIENS